MLLISESIVLQIHQSPLSRFDERWPVPRNVDHPVANDEAPGETSRKLTP